MAKYVTGKPILCPLATAHPPVYKDLEPGAQVEPGSRIKMVDGSLLRVQPSETGEPFVAPDGAKLEMPQPAEGLRHTAVFEEMPEGYATERWKGNRKEEPYLKCPVCGATFPKWGIEEYLADK
jgi:hypothetical protein